MIKKVNSETPSWRKGSDIFETFALELEEFSQNGTVPPHAGQDVAWSLEQQKKRLDSLELELDYRFTPRDTLATGSQIPSPGPTATISAGWHTEAAASTEPFPAEAGPSTGRTETS